MKIRTITALAIVATATVALSACGTTASSAGAKSDSKGNIKIGVSFDKSDDSFRVGEKKYLDQYAKQMGITLVYQDAQSDAQTQSSQVQSFISQKVAGIIEIPWDTQAVAADVSAAKAANIPLAIMDQEPASTKDVFYFVGGNPTTDGEAAGNYLVKAAAGKKIQVLELQGSLNNINGIQRSKGFESAVAKASNITIVAKSPTQWDASNALSATQNALQAHPKIGAIYAPWTGALPAIYSALKAVNKLEPVGKSGHVITMSINGDQIGCKYVTNNSDDIDIATPVQAMAKDALKAVKDYAKDGTKPAKAIDNLTGLAYTPSTLTSLKSKVWGCN